MKTKILTAVLLASVLATSCKPLRSPAQRYQSKVAAPAEYPAWLKRHTPFFGHGNASLKRANDFLDQSKAALKKKAEEEAMAAKVAAINAKTEKLNNQN